jgi:chlorophyll(ide) b reductase
MNKGFRPLVEFSDEEISQIVSTNLTGSLICTREAIRVMKKQPKGGHIFNMDGAGSGGASTPLTAAYGATKCGLRQLSGSLLQECKGSRVGIHTASPGMVLTELLLRYMVIYQDISRQPDALTESFLISGHHFTVLCF